MAIPLSNAYVRPGRGLRASRLSGIRHAAAMAGIVLGLGLAGCTVGPDYHAPAVSLTRFQNAAAVDERIAPPAPRLDIWWTGFHDPALTRIIRRALAQNLDLAAAMARVQQARAAAASAGAQLLPTVDANADATALHQSVLSPFGAVGSAAVPGYNRDQREYDVGAAASWEIDLFGGLRRGAQAAKAEAQAAEADRLGTRISVAADAADAYFQVRGDQTRLAVAQQQIVVDQHLLDLVRQRQAAGAGNDREVAQATALLQQAQTTIPPLRIDLAVQLNRVDVLMGVQPGTYAQELAVPAAIPAIPAIPGGDQPLDVLRRRPDIIAAEREVAAANARIGVAIADYYPKLSLSGLVGFDSMGANTLFTARGFQAAGTGALRWRLFDFGKVDAEVASARGADAEKLARYRQSVLHAAEDIENAFVALTQTETRTQQLQEEVVSLTKARDLSQQSYEAGTTALTDVLDSDRQLLVTQDGLAQNRTDAARAAVRSFRALGGGWTA
ncbi:MAG TPA: efflux transporter outer membrane subunit [Acetobacteraceae bacterium]|nr:efflux transporter outer membrane subunit [Acetobacteraceae bacterium]